MNRVLVLGASIPRMCARRISTTEARCFKPDMTSVKKKQIQFQVDNDVPINFKGGPVDRVFFYTTLGLIAYSFYTAMYASYKLAVKK